ncbi:S4 domain protein YaaA [Clostridium botulinum E1 str. 'BoNT E Beluga']|nr:S4 domain protein YaaA [Clostridium botulinum E1 str. 'BoNT E Beluga']
MQKNMNKIEINTEIIKLDAFLKWSGIASLGSEAKIYIQEGLIKVNGEICLQRGKKLKAGDIIEFEDEKFEIV